MLLNAPKVLGPEQVAAAFAHNITWEDDIWRADPVDVEIVHSEARTKFSNLLNSVTADGGARAQARILLFHGQSGAGKTHLIRALRTSSHRTGKAFFGYAQMSPDVANYADYFLRRFIAALEKPYDPDGDPQTALARLTEHLVEGADIVPADLETLRENALDPETLAHLVIRLADQIVMSPRFSEHGLDINLVRAFLYFYRSDTRIEQRARQYLYGRPLGDLAQKAVMALDPHSGQDRAFELLEGLGKLIWAVDKASLVFCIDQVEDLRFFGDPEERFQKAVRDLIQIANRVPTAIIIISCLGDFYTRVREMLAQSYIDRIERSGPVHLGEMRSASEARLMIAKRLQASAGSVGGLTLAEAEALFSPQFYEEFMGLSPRRLLESAQTRCVQQLDQPQALKLDASESFISTLARALGMASFGGPEPVTAPAPSPAPAPVPLGVDYREPWERFVANSMAELPSEDGELLAVLLSALGLAKDEWPGLTVKVDRLTHIEDVPAADVSVRHPAGQSFEMRLFLCNRPIQGTGIKRQIERIVAASEGKNGVMLRTSEFPPAKKSATGQQIRQFRETGGRTIVVPLLEWERMMMVREFHAHHRFDQGFALWFEHAKLLTGLNAFAQLLRLDLLGRLAPRSDAKEPAALPGLGNGGVRPLTSGDALPYVPAKISGAIANLQTEAALASPVPSEPAAPDGPDEEELPLSVLLDEGGGGMRSIMAGRELSSRASPVSLNRDVLKRHTAVLGGSGSGKTTLALSIIEQLLLRGIPAVLIDRKGDLCSYANPDVWRAQDGEQTDRRGDRERLSDAIDVAVYTPGRSSGRPISITLLPTGIGELPDHEQQLLANMSAAALGEMLHLKNSATHQKQSGTLSVALRILGSRFRTEVTLADLIHLLEEEDPELTELTQRMDPSGRIRRDLIGQLDSLRHRNSSLFEGGGESLKMESLLGLGPYTRSGRTRLSIIYTGFLGDNENILFWVSQFLGEALRFCQRNPNDSLQAVVMFDEADLYIPANAKPATSEPLQSLLKRARSAGLGIMLATQSPGDLDYRSRDQITSWFIGRVREDTALKKLKAAFQSESGLDPAAVLPGQTVGEFHLVQEGLVRALKAQRSLIDAEQVPFDRIEQLARETKGQDERQLRLFG